MKELNEQSTTDNQIKAETRSDALVLRASTGYIPLFNILDRVCIHIKDIPKEDVVCNTGIVVGISVRFIHTPERRSISYSIRLDGDKPYAAKKFLFAIGPMITIRDGYNAGDQITAKKI